MMNLRLIPPGDRPLRILCLGAHSDDIEIGCGGTLLRLLGEYPGCQVHWVVFSAIGVRRQEAELGAALFATPKHLAQTIFRELPDTMMPFVGPEVRAVFEELKAGPLPDLVFTHNRRDAHQDHRLISELTSNAYRDHLILEYEIPKYDGDMGQPQCFVPLDEPICANKVKNILAAFPSQRGKRWFTADLFFALLRLRGMECNAASGFAEAFYTHKVVL